MQVFAPPVSLAYVELKLAERALQALPFAAFAPGTGLLGRKFLQMGTHEAGEGGIAFNCDFPYFFNQLVV